ncbi:hypothetical protein SAMN05216410_3650 [Sanguibacter gelidistatuariae]|uniref:N-acetyltransferase domain-containing protein n=1 Tax=Sanguibacter gelidistatuariae TaxID=1814289 RepID=A0A1G6WI47_9MICO|nr:GNAT family N-acetyltransferase [Sanguibacter gelidistatuariae]SDD65552.1 hypothetical protein SAMN05216410_3650 [Sanguibacter gelidistatuariae]
MSRSSAPPPPAGPDGPAGVDVVELTDPAALTALHTHVLAPSFPPAELCSLDELLEGCASGELQAVGVLREGRVIAGAVASGTPGGVVLLAYLALAPGERGAGVGGALLEGALARWVATVRPAYVLAEVEHPGHHEGSVEHGDPAARLRFYARHGARLLAVPYFQPKIGPQGTRVPALLLVTLYVDPTLEFARPDGSGGAVTEVSAPPLRDFLVAYLRSSEGALGEDDAVRSLLGAVSGERVALLGPGELDRVPVGLLGRGVSPPPGSARPGGKAG